MLKSLHDLFKINLEQEFKTLFGIMIVNSHELPIYAPGQNAIYTKTSLIQHSCISNASKHFDINGIITIRASRFIKKGEQLSITYSDPMWGTSIRQVHLQETKFFQCKCARCIDPCELNTDFSSIKCSACQNGYYTPLQPLNSRSDWECNICKDVTPSKSVLMITKAIGEVVVQIEKNSVESCLNFIKRHSQNIHPNHYFLMDVKLALCQMLGKQSLPNSVKVKELLKKQAICMDLLKVVNIINPGNVLFD